MSVSAKFSIATAIHRSFAELATAVLLTLGILASAVNAEVVVQHQGANDPTSEGFTFSDGGFPNAVAPLLNDGGEPAWAIAVITPRSQVGYSQGITALQNNDLLTKGFQLDFEARAFRALAPAFDTNNPAGIASAIFDTGTRRFDIALGIDAQGDTVVSLPTSISVDPTTGYYEVPGQTYTLTGLGNDCHDYSLVYDPKTELADLFVDGTLRISGYAGHTSFVTPTPGLAFGVSSGGQGDFNFVRLSTVPEASSVVLLGIGGLAFVIVACRHSFRRSVSMSSKDLV